jgi:hypothetical protein
MRTTATNRKLRELLTGIGKGILIPRPEFQRRLVWANKHKVAFIETVLNGYPFPEIYIAAGKVDPDTGEAQEYLVDGQQRITTLYQYFTRSSDIKLPSNIKPFAELDDKQKKDFLQYDVVMRDLGEMEMSEILEVFTRINSTSYALNAMEIHNARYDGELKRFAEEFSESEFFEKHRIFSPTDIKRMNDLRYVLTIIVTTMSAYFNRDEELEEYLKKYNDEFPEKIVIKGKLEQTCSIIEKCGFEEGSKVWKKADLFTLFVEFHKCLYIDKLEINVKKISKKLKDFYKKVNKVDPNQVESSEIYEYYKAALQASNDRNNRRRRGEIIAEMLRAATGFGNKMEKNLL